MTPALVGDFTLVTPALVTADQVALQLLVNSCRNGHQHSKWAKLPLVTSESNTFTWTFTMTEMVTVIKSLKIVRQQAYMISLSNIKDFGQGALTWLMNMFNHCIASNTIPKAWQKAKIIALLKPEKDPSISRNCRPFLNVWFWPVWPPLLMTTSFLNRWVSDQ